MRTPPYKPGDVVVLGNGREMGEVRPNEDGEYCHRLWADGAYTVRVCRPELLWVDEDQCRRATPEEEAAWRLRGKP